MGLLENLPIVLKFCCCISLRNGNIVIGVVSLLAIVLSYGGNAAFLILRHRKQHITDDQVRILLGMWFILLIYVLPKIILNMVLIVGALKRKSSLLGIYLWTTLVYIGLEAISILIALGALPFSDFIPWYIIAVAVTVFVIQIYFWMCVDSYYVTLKLENRFSVRQQMRGAMLQFDPAPSSNVRQQNFPMRRLLSAPPHLSVLSN